MKMLVDTNVIVDVLTGREPFREAAEQIFMMAANQIEDMYITASSTTDIYYLTRKHIHNTDQAKIIMSKLYELFYILDVTSDDCREALSSGIKDYEDAVVAHCANRNKMDYIVTRNSRDFECSRVQAVLPEDFLKMIMSG